MFIACFNAIVSHSYSSNIVNFVEETDSLRLIGVSSGDECTEIKSHNYSKSLNKWEYQKSTETGEWKEWKTMRFSPAPPPPPPHPNTHKHTQSLPPPPPPPTPQHAKKQHLWSTDMITNGPKQRYLCRESERNPQSLGLSSLHVLTQPLHFTSVLVTAAVRIYTQCTLSQMMQHSL